MPRVKLVVMPPVEPMLAKRSSKIPVGDGWVFEPKWDGFRTLVFRDGDEVYLQSRDKKPMNRYFPELEAPLLKALPEKCVLDGEIVLAQNGRLEFESLQMRLHPAASRVKKLAAEIPTAMVFWDLLAIGDENLCGLPFAVRRERLMKALEFAEAPVHLTPSTTDPKLAEEWFTRFEGAGLDGVMAKPATGLYQPGKRAMIKVKHVRTAECVVAGFRWHKAGTDERVGSLLLGLYDEAARLHHVGVTSSFTMAMRRQLVTELAPLREQALDHHPWRDWPEGAGADGGDPTRMPGGQSRWSAGKDLSWQPLRIERVCEVKYDHMQGPRFRHAAVFQRWRLDKRPSDCGYDQLEVTAPYELAKVFGAATRHR
jgi:ATP-dependent DNA ligase